MTQADRIPYDANKVKFLINGRSNGYNMSREKEVVARYTVVAANPAFNPKDKYTERHVTPISVVVYMGRSSSASTVYASIWAQSRRGAKLTNVFTEGKKGARGKRLSMDPALTIWVSGKGNAGGYGYHKESAAIEDAIDSAGFKLEGHFGGCGDTAAKHAIAAVARFLGWRNFTIITG